VDSITLLTYFLNNWALAYAQPSQVAIAIYIQPVVAAAFAYFWLGTEITWRTVFSSLLIFLGLFLAIVMPDKQRAKHDHHPDHKKAAS
jgi:drug/metabolite transporter (DMT)-like permease